MSKFIPKVLLLGNENEIPNDLPEFKIVGKIEIRNESNWFFNGIQIALQDLLKRNFDYILCTNYKIYERSKHRFYAAGLPIGSVITQQFFKRHVSNSMYVITENVMQLTRSLERIEYEDPNFKTILDADSYFYRNGIFDFPDQFFNMTRSIDKKFSIESICDENLDPIFENIYTRQFKSLDEIKLRFYDLILLAAERSLDEWISILHWAIESSNRIICFIHETSPALASLTKISIDRGKISWRQAFRGFWLEIKIDRENDARIWVTTHKKCFMPELPAGYQWILGGRKISNLDLGIQSDDTGENVSELNLKINELTALYWVWKNCPTDFVGFAHYRRFFVLPSDGEFPIRTWGEHIATIDELIDLLRDCDVILGKVTEWQDSLTKSFDEIDGDNGMDVGYRIFLKHFRRIHPEYLATLEKTETRNRMFTNTMIFTRWKFFDAYCEWLFSFLIPATVEFDDSKYTNGFETRIMSCIGERMLTTFLTQNHIRFKTVTIALGSQESFDPKNFAPRIFII